MTLHIERRMIARAVCNECGRSLFLPAEEPTIPALLRHGWLFHYLLDDPPRPEGSSVWLCCAECAEAPYVLVEAP